jgi:hypothetical protein
MPEACTECRQPLIEIDNRRQRLRGCMTCNEWYDDKGNLIRLPLENLSALHARRRK